MENSGAAERQAEPLVRCGDCGFEWHGEISADGLRVLGHCPRCEGKLQFRDERPAGASDADSQAEGEQQPWQVLGTPYSWAR